MTFLIQRILLYFKLWSPFTDFPRVTHFCPFFFYFVLSLFETAYIHCSYEPAKFYPVFLWKFWYLKSGVESWHNLFSRYNHAYTYTFSPIRWKYHAFEQQDKCCFDRFELPSMVDWKSSKLTYFAAITSHSLSFFYCTMCSSTQLKFRFKIFR